MSMYAGLTDDLNQRKGQHGNPNDWKGIGPFPSEQVARDWEKQMLARGYEGGPGGKGWKFGYTYTITPQTIE